METGAPGFAPGATAPGMQVFQGVPLLSDGAHVLAGMMADMAQMGASNFRPALPYSTHLKSRRTGVVIDWTEYMAGLSGEFENCDAKGDTDPAAWAGRTPAMAEPRPLPAGPVQPAAPAAASGPPALAPLEPGGRLGPVVHGLPADGSDVMARMGNVRGITPPDLTPMRSGDEA
jgi:hypothetical protein